MKLKLCCECGDVKKDEALDLYYVDKMNVSQTPTVLCHSCLINILLQNEVVVD